METHSRSQWGIIAGVIVLLFASALFGQSEASRNLEAPPGSTYNINPDGLSAIHQILQERDQAFRWERGPHRLTADVATLVLWDPFTPDDDAWEDLMAWVDGGGRLLIGGAVAQYKVDLHTWGTGQEGRPAAITPEVAGLSEIILGRGAPIDPPPQAVVHITRWDGTPALISWDQGQGHIYWSADTEWLSNKQIRYANNLDLALRLLTPPPGQRTAFDEYHHGYQVAERWWQILRGNLQIFVLQLGIALLLLYWAYWVRFGAPRPLPASPPRAAVEYVYSMSQLYRRARARSVVLQTIHRSLVRTLSQLLGGAGGLTHTEIARRVADRARIPAEDIRALLDKTDPDRKPEPDDAELLRLAREAEELQRRVRNAGYRDQRDPGKGAGGAS